VLYVTLLRHSLRVAWTQARVARLRQRLLSRM